MSASPRRRHNVYRASRRLDGTVALACLLGALIVAGLIATSEQPLSQSQPTSHAEVYNPWQ